MATLRALRAVRARTDASMLALITGGSKQTTIWGFQHKIKET